MREFMKGCVTLFFIFLISTAVSATNARLAFVNFDNNSHKKYEWLSPSLAEAMHKALKKNFIYSRPDTKKIQQRLEGASLFDPENRRIVAEEYKLDYIVFGKYKRTKNKFTIVTVLYHFHSDTIVKSLEARAKANKNLFKQIDGQAKIFANSLQTYIRSSKPDEGGQIGIKLQKNLLHEAKISDLKKDIGKRQNNALCAFSFKELKTWKLSSHEDKNNWVYVNDSSALAITCAAGKVPLKKWAASTVKGFSKKALANAPTKFHGQDAHWLVYEKPGLFTDQRGYLLMIKRPRGGLVLSFVATKEDYAAQVLLVRLFFDEIQFQP